jgi:hypothetical protein
MYGGGTEVVRGYYGGGAGVLSRNARFECSLMQV